jgi:hypothetical protein
VVDKAVGVTVLVVVVVVVVIIEHRRPRHQQVPVAGLELVRVMS